MRGVCELENLLDRAQSILIDARNRAELNGILGVSRALDEVLPRLFEAHRQLTGGEDGIRLWAMIEHDLREHERAKHEIEARRNMLLDQMAYRSPGSGDPVQGGDRVPVAQRFLEAEEADMRIRSLKARVTRVEAAMALLSPLERSLVSLRYFHGMAWEDVARELCVCRREALRIRREILGRISPLWVR